MATTHATLTGLLAGFALAGFILLLELRPSNSRRQSITDQRAYESAVLLTFLAFAVGASAAFMYSAISGEDGDTAFTAFPFPSALFALEATVLLVALNHLVEALEINVARGPIGWFSRLVMAVAASAVVADIDQLLIFGGYSGPSRALIYTLWALPLFGALVVRQSRHYQRARTETILFSYAVIAGTVLIGSPFIVRYRFRYRPESIFLTEQAVTIVTVSILLAWAGIILVSTATTTDERSTTAESPDALAASVPSTTESSP